MGTSDTHTCATPVTLPLESRLMLAAFVDLAGALPPLSNGWLACADYDADGDLDVAHTGANESHIYRNDGDLLVDVVADLPGLNFSHAAWGDYDADGDLDILITGYLHPSSSATGIFRNDGGTFVDSGAVLPDVMKGAAAWGDYDADGDLDILITGWDSIYGPIGRIYRNTGGAFADIGAGLTGVYLSSAAWGDYDNDGDLDVLVEGQRPGSSSTVQIYRNNGGGFAPAGGALVGLSNTSAAWTDYDGDGDLDILLAGEVDGQFQVQRVHRNDGDAFTDTGGGLPGPTARAWAVYAGDGTFTFSTDPQVPVEDPPDDPPVIDGEAIYVATWGNDASAGSSDAPLATLTGARDAIRAMKANDQIPAGGVTVYLREGTYHLSASFVLSAEDSGTADAPIAYKAYPGETVSLSGGLTLDADWFQPVTSSSSAYYRLPSIARGQVVQVNLPAHGITDFGQMSRRAGWTWDAIAGLELFYNGQAMQLGQWPNDGFAYTVDTPLGKYGRQFTTTAGYDRLARWAQAEDPFFGGLFAAYWFHAQVGGTVNASAGTVTLDASPYLGVDPGAPYMAFNMLEEVDQPGEWYLNRDTGMLYFWAPGPLTDGSVQVSMLEDDLLTLNNVEHVTFSGLTLESSRAGIVDINGGAHNTIRKSVIRNAGTYGANITGSDNGLEWCEVYGVGESAVMLLDGDRPTLAAAGNFVRNSELHDWSRIVRSSKAGVRLEGVGQIVSHNEIYDAPHLGIWVLGNDHLIEYNDFHHLSTETADTGAIYAGRDWGYRGTVIQYNYFHDLHSMFTPWEVFGVYLDDAVSGFTVRGNIFADIAGYATLNCGGRDNVFTNNIIAHAYGGHRTDRRGVDIINNVPGSDLNFLEKLFEASGGNFKTGAWGAAYPELQPIPTSFYELGDYKNPGGSVFSRNYGHDLASSSKWLNEGSWGGPDALDWYDEVANNILGSDPRFVDEASGNMNLRPDSPVWSIPGWQAIPFDDIGPEPAPDDETPPDDPPFEWPDDVIVDNQEGGFATTGTWYESSAVDEYAGSSLYSSGSGASASWSADLGVPGEWEVYVWTSAANASGSYYMRDSRASYTVHHAGGQSVVEIDQNAAPGQWVSIGTWSFRGSPAVVTVTHDAQDSANTSADAVKFVFTPDAEVIVDDLDSGFVTVGEWRASGAVDYYGERSMYANDIGASATWTPTLSFAGTYEVYAWWTAERSDGAHYDRDSNAEYLISFDGSFDIVMVDQDLDAGQWVLLGTYDFAAGTDGFVQLTRDDIDGVATSADAVRFVLVETV